MYKFLFISYIIISIFLVFFIMFQDNKKTNIGSSLDINSSINFIKTQNSNIFINKIIYVTSILFFVFSLIITNASSNKNKKDDFYIVNKIKEKK